MELPPGLAEIQRKNKTKVKSQKKKKKRSRRDDSPNRELSESKYKARVVPKLNHTATFRLFSQRLNVNTSEKCKLIKKRKLVFPLPKLFFPRFEGVETNKNTDYKDDILWIHQLSESGDKECLYRLNLTEISAIDDLDWGDDIESSESSSGSWGNSDFELPSLATFLARTTVKSVTCDHVSNENEHWHLEMDIDREKQRFVLKKVVFTLKKR